MATREQSRLSDAVPANGRAALGSELGDSRNQMAENESAVLFLIRMMERRKWTVLLSMILIPLLTMVAISRMTPLYTSTITVIMEQKDLNVGNLSPIFADQAQAPTIESQIEIVQSRTIAERTVDELGLILKPEFNHALGDNEGGLLSGLFTTIGNTVLSVTGVSLFSADPPIDPALNREEVVKTFQSRLDVKPRGRSGVLAISFTSEDPQLAKDAVTTIANLYIDNQLEVKFQAMQRAQGWLNQQLEQLKDRVEASERGIEEFRAKEGLVAGVRGTIVTEQVSDMSRQLVDAQANLADAESRLAQVRAMARRGSGSTLDEMRFPGLQQLRAEETRVLAELSQMRATRGDSHPDVRAKQAEYQKIRSQVVGEVGKASSAVEAEVRAAESRVNSLKNDLSGGQSRATKADTASIQLRAMEREANADQELLQTFLQRSKEISQQFDIEQPDARVLSAAYVPNEASFPSKKLFMVIAIVVGAVIGLLLAYIEELLDQTFRSSDELEAAFGAPAVNIPKIGRPGWRVPFLDYVLVRPASVFAENVRSMRTLLWLADRGTRANCVVVTSSRSGEGKTTTAVALARASALSGEKVIIVDADLSRPSIHATFKHATPDHGLTDLLAGQAGRHQVTRTDQNLTNLQYITAGRDLKQGSELLRSDNMISLVRELRREYDLVVLDTPPTLAVSDAKVLASMADAVIYCVRGRSTTSSAVNAGIKSLTDVGANLAVMALTQVKLKSSKGSYRRDAELYARGRASRTRG